MISGSLVCRASDVSGWLSTLDWEDDVGEHFFDLPLASDDHSVASLLSQELVRLLGFSETFKEDRKVKLVTELFEFDPPFDLAGGSVEGD